MRGAGGNSLSLWEMLLREVLESRVRVAVRRQIPGGYAIMPKYVIEREIPNAGRLSPQELKGVSQTSCGVLKNLGPEIQWVESYVTDDRVYCIYIAPNEEMIREHAKQGGFPANKISAVRSVISPTTAE